MPSRQNLSQPEIPPADTTEVLPVSPELAALFRAHGVINQARRADEFTPEDYAAYTSLTANEAARVLKDDFAAGKLTRRRWGKSFLYRFADGWK